MMSDLYLAPSNASCPSFQVNQTRFYFYDKFAQIYVLNKTSQDVHV